MNITPRSILKGRNSDGSSFSVAQWDFNTISNMQTTGLLVGLVVGLITSSIASPVILLFSLLAFNGRLNMGFILSALISGYFLLDCHNGWITISAINIFFTEPTINLLVSINTASLLISLILILFGGTIYGIINSPVKDINELDAQYLTTTERTNLNGQLTKRLIGFAVIIFIIGLIGFSVGVSVTKKHKGWVESNIENVEAQKKDQKEQEDRDAIGNYPTKEARDAHFDSLQKEFGN